MKTVLYVHSRHISEGSERGETILSFHGGSLATGPEMGTTPPELPEFC